MTNQPDRLVQVESLLQQMAISLKQQQDASNERMTRLEQTMERYAQESNERMTRFESGLEETRQLVHSNNRFLESFSQDLRKYTDSMNNLATRIDSVIATSNQDRQQTNSRLSVIERLVRAIATHLGVAQ